MWHWMMDFVGVNNGEDPFATHMYNFWSGFGGNVSVLALIGTLIGVYRHHRRSLTVALHPLRSVRRRPSTGAPAPDEPESGDA